MQGLWARGSLAVSWEDWEGAIGGLGAKMGQSLTSPRTASYL